jgi:L-aspartate oxidase
LDLSHLEPDFVRRRFPGIHATCLKFGLDITKHRIPVRPGAHYVIGGVTVDPLGRTTLPNLWAAGEATSSGLHGANRLASNSLLEALVLGARAGAEASRAARSMPDRFSAMPLENAPVEHHAAPLDLADISNSLQSLMWRSVGVQRSGDQLKETAATIDLWRQYVLPLQFENPVGWELQNMLTIARIMVEAAITRTESRGVHLRKDHPHPDDARWKCRIRISRTHAGNTETTTDRAG